MAFYSGKRYTMSEYNFPENGREASAGRSDKTFDAHENRVRLNEVA